MGVFGQGYQRYLLVFFVIGSVALLFPTTDIHEYLPSGARSKSPERYNIPPGARTRKILDQAKKAIGEAEPGEALRRLSELNLTALEAEIDLLSGRILTGKPPLY